MLDALDVMLLAGTFVAVCAVPGLLIWWWGRRSTHVHRWRVPDLAFFDGQRANLFRGKCNCGAQIIKTGAEWKKMWWRIPEGLHYKCKPLITNDPR